MVRLFKFIVRKDAEYGFPGLLFCWLEFGLGFWRGLLDACLLFGDHGCCTSGEADVQAALLAGSGILVNDSLLGSLVECRGEVLIECLGLVRICSECSTKLLLIGLETAQNTGVAGVADLPLTGTLDSGAAFLDGCFGGCHMKGLVG